VRPLTVATAASPPRAHRIGFLDALRGIAVSLVLLQHVGELLFPAVRELSASTLQLGQFGVTVFFLCSGFIIPASLERGGTASRRRALATFWTGRVFRLYPLYWLSLAGAGLLVVAGRHTPEQPLTGSDWLANASMLQMLVGSPHALGLYWTLGLEMVFYLAVSVLFLLGWHQRSAVLSLAASGGCLAAAALSGPLGISAPLGAFCLATMFTGTVVHRWHTGTLGLPAVAGCVGAVLARAACCWPRTPPPHPRASPGSRRCSRPGWPRTPSSAPGWRCGTAPHRPGCAGWARSASPST
jgi:Acyltransferase family